MSEGQVKEHAERRRGADDALMVLVQQVVSNQNAMDERLAQHMVDVTEALAKAMAKMMADSFPEGDPQGHRRYHESSIRQAEAKAEFWSKLRIELAKYGLVGFIGWALFALWQAFLQGPHK